MTLDEAVRILDEECPNTCPRQTKLRWLSELDGQLYAQVVAAHQEGLPQWRGYDESSPGATVLLVPLPYDAPVYGSYLKACLYRDNGEFPRHDAAAAAFREAAGAYARAYHRGHTPAFSGGFRF